MKGLHHHIHERKRVHLEKQEYPSKNPYIHFLDDLVLMIAFLFPLSAAPQVYKIWVERAVDGVAIITWIIWLILSVPMLVYGFVHKEKPIIIMYSLWLIVHTSVIIGVFMYG
ncbi:hypothetical protein GOV05_00615 [Candidatus Woesearchaeota archaeon]|nr:hypothetical protein [Candidatus Woesearchaeota archaeon]